MGMFPQLELGISRDLQQIRQRIIVPKENYTKK